MPTETPSAHARTSASPIVDVDPRTVQGWLDAGECLLIDVREADEHARERIPAAKLLPLSSFDPSALRPEKGQRIVLHCRSGRRSADAAAKLVASMGPGQQVHNLRGGIERWKADGLPVATNRSAPRLGVLQQTQLTIGICVLAGLAIGYFTEYRIGYLLSAFMGCGLLLAGFTGLCPLASLIARLPWNRVDGHAGECADGRCGGH